MRSPLWTAAMLGMTCLMAGCGGGSGASDAPQNTLNAASCDSTTLWAVPASQSGLAITDNNTSGISVTWDNQTCTLQTVSSVSLDICLTHPAPDDLLWKITPPSSGASLPITVPANWNSTGTDCDLGNSVFGKLQRINLLPTVQPTVAIRGLWTLNVSDQRRGDTGNLVQWRLLVQGLN